MASLSDIPVLRSATRWASKRIDAKVEELTAKRLAELDTRLQKTESAVAWLREQINRMAPHLAGIETRLADAQFAQRLAAADLPEAEYALVVEAELELRRARALIQAITHYEDRLRRLEERLL